MKIKEIHKKIVRDTFFYLVIATILISIYHHFNPHFFPKLQVKLAIVTAIFGVGWVFITFVGDKKIKLRVKEIKNARKKLIVFLAGFVFYSIFLNWAYLRFSFDEFMFFILVIYIPISHIFGLEPRIPIVIALVLLVVCAVVLAYGYEDVAERIAIYSYYCLVIGTSLLFLDYLRGSDE